MLAKGPATSSKPAHVGHDVIWLRPRLAFHALFVPRISIAQAGGHTIGSCEGRAELRH